MGSGKNIPESCPWLCTEETQASVWPDLLASLNRKEACRFINSANTIRWYFKTLSCHSRTTGNQKLQDIKQNQYNKYNQENKKEIRA